MISPQASAAPADLAVPARGRARVIYGVLRMVACHERTCALCAPTVFSARMKSVSAQKTKFQWRLMREARYAGTKTRLWIKTRTARGFYTRSPIGCGCAFHPCPIGDPRGRLLVRATSQLCRRRLSPAYRPRYSAPKPWRRPPPIHWRLSTVRPNPAPS